MTPLSDPHQILIKRRIVFLRISRISPVVELDSRRTGSVGTSGSNESFETTGTTELYDINAHTVADVVKQYNKVFFGSILDERLQASSKQLSIRVGDSIPTGIFIPRSGKVIQLSVSKKYLSQVEIANRFERRYGPYSTYITLMYAVERLILSLFLGLWDIGTVRLPKSNENIIMYKNEDSKAYKCAYDTFFGGEFVFSIRPRSSSGLDVSRTDTVELEDSSDQISEIDLSDISEIDLSASISSSHSSPSVQRKGFVWYDNSCYIDSLLMCMLVSPFIRIQIQQTKTEKIDYKPSSICTIDSRIDGKDDLRKIAFSIQKEMQRYYESVIVEHEHGQCSNIRQLLLKCLTDMKENGRWVFYNVSTIWNTFCSLFPRLLQSVYARIVDPTTKITKIGKPGLISRANFTFWDFLDSYRDADDKYTEILWEELENSRDNYLLVFQNGGYPAIKYYNKEGEEIVKSRKYVQEGKRTKIVVENIKVFKKRKFSEYILERKYRLFGVVLLHGVSVGEEGGTHYTALVREGNKWYEYDDVGPKYKYISEKVPETCFQEIGRTKPELYFYGRVSE